MGMTTANTTCSAGAGSAKPVKAAAEAGSAAQRPARRRQRGEPRRHLPRSLGANPTCSAMQPSTVRCATERDIAPAETLELPRQSLLVCWHTGGSGLGGAARAYGLQMWRWTRIQAFKLSGRALTQHGQLDCLACFCPHPPCNTPRDPSCSLFPVADHLVMSEREWRHGRRPASLQAQSSSSPASAAAVNSRSLRSRM